jgi:hypothetical protein
VLPDTTVGVLVMRAYSPFGPQALYKTGRGCGPRTEVAVLLAAVDAPATDVVTDPRELRFSPRGRSQCGALDDGSGRREGGIASSRWIPRQTGFTPMRLSGYGASGSESDMAAMVEATSEVLSSVATTED